jgi:hypothetical protein
VNGRRGGSANARRRYASSSKAGPTRQNGLPSRDESAPARAREPIVEASQRIHRLAGGYSWREHQDPVGPHVLVLLRQTPAPPSLWQLARRTAGRPGTAARNRSSRTRKCPRRHHCRQSGSPQFRASVAVTSLSPAAPPLPRRLREAAFIRRPRPHLGRKGESGRRRPASTGYGVWSSPATEPTTGPVRRLP